MAVSRKRGPADEVESSWAENSNHLAARRAYRVALFSMIPGLGLLLGPAAVLLGCLALPRVPDDTSSRNRVHVAIWMGALVALTQWLGIALILRSG